MQRELIQQQIQELRTRSHIQKIKQIDQNSYYITYSPILTQSPYSHLVFIVKIILPQNYPEHSPFITFKDKIYHLNIDPITGQVFMPILKDDWSPFLTLSAVFDSLNNLLEEPEVDYAACETLRLEYLNQPQKYAQKVSQMVNICTKQPKEEEENSRSMAQHVEEIIEFRSEDGLPALDHSIEKDYMHEEHERYNIGLTKSIQFDEGLKIQQDFLESPVNDNKFIKIYTEESNNDKPRQRQQERLQNKIQIDSDKKIKEAIKTGKITSHFDKNHIEASHFEKKEQFDQVQISLRKSDQLIEILLQGCQSMQNTVKNSSNERVRKMLQKKLQEQWIMVQQLLQMTSRLKQKLFNNLKAQTKQLLK